MKTVLVATVSVLVSTLSWGVTIPNTFSSGDPALASEVNENFTELANGINTNEAGVSENAEQIDENVSVIDANANVIGTNATNIIENTNAISAFGSAVSVNSTNINNNSDGISANTTNIATNSDNIGINSANISSNSDDISDNTTDISANTNSINTNSNAIDTINADIENLNAIVGVASPTSFVDYYMGPSSSGAVSERNVVVWDDGNGCYTARLWFTNTTGEEIDNATTTVTPDEVFIFQTVCGDASQVTSEEEYLYALPSSGSAPWYGFDQAEGFEANLDSDGDGSFDIQIGENYRFTHVRNPLGNMELVHSNEFRRDAAGEITFTSNFSSIITNLGESLTVNGMTFNDVAVVNYNDLSSRVDFNAKGIGPVLVKQVLNGTLSLRKMIYYRLDGDEQGSVAGTPFVSGDLINLWF